MADIYNNIAATGKCPNEFTHSILRVLQKSGKPKGLRPNLQPIILVYILRKILAVLQRVNSRLDSAIPTFSAAYCKDRST